jgi:hypothetical protein
MGLGYPGILKLNISLKTLEFTNKEILTCDSHKRYSQMNLFTDPLLHDTAIEKLHHLHRICMPRIFIHRVQGNNTDEAYVPLSRLIMAD